MTSKQLKDEQREARYVTRSAYVHKTIRTKEFGNVTVTASGAAYLNKAGTLHRIGVVGKNGKSEFLRVEGPGVKGKSARRAEKRARQRARLAGAQAGGPLSTGPSNGHGQVERQPAAPAYSMVGGGQ